MLSCKDVSQLLSESLDRNLPFWKRLSLWTHLGMCRLCRAFRKDLQHLHKRTRQQAEEIEADTSAPQVTLPDESRQRLKRVLESHKPS
ncbi:MAG: hypothetical protein HY000_16780 [Planctomycetes bacterium]|nr:hypothetical protein [Planctomycetia bacterium]MBI3464689.1 hypothetical protein [Planctomycetota bacterium]